MFSRHPSACKTNAVLINWARNLARPGIIPTGQRPSAAATVGSPYSKARAAFVRAGLGIDGIYDREAHPRPTMGLSAFTAYSPTAAAITFGCRQDALLGDFLAYVEALRGMGRPIIFCGDINTSHCEIDLRGRAKTATQRVSAHQRAWLDEVERGYLDTFRTRNPELAGRIRGGRKLLSREKERRLAAGTISLYRRTCGRESSRSVFTPMLGPIIRLGLTLDANGDGG